MVFVSLRVLMYARKAHFRIMLWILSGGILVILCVSLVMKLILLFVLEVRFFLGDFKVCLEAIEVQEEETHEERVLSDGEITLIVFGAIIFCAILFVSIYYLRKSRKKPQNEMANADDFHKINEYSFSIRTDHRLGFPTTTPASPPAKEVLVLYIQFNLSF